MSQPPYGHPGQPGDPYAYNQPSHGGAAQPGAPYGAQPAYGGPPPPKPKSNTALWAALAALVVLAAAVVTVILVNRGGSNGGGGGGGTETVDPEAQQVVSVVEGFMDSVIDGDLDGAKKYLCPDLAETLSDPGLDGSNVTYEVGEPEISGDTAEVPVDLTEDGENEPGILVLEKQDGEWLICDAKDADSSSSPSS